MAAVAVILIAHLLVGENDSLLRHATRVPLYRIRDRALYPSAWGWSSGHELVFLDWSAPPERAIRKIDIATGLQSTSHLPMPPGYAQLSALGREESISPDGRFLAVLRWTHKPELREHVLVDRETGAITKLPVETPDWVHWSADGKSCILRAEDGYTVFDVRTHAARTYHGVPIDGASVSWFGGGDWVTSSKRSSEGYVTLPIKQVSLRDGKSRILPVTLPQGATITEVSLSPRGDCLAWWVAWRHAEPSLLDRVLHWAHRRPAPRAGDTGWEGVYVSKPDGSDMRELGRVRMDYAPDGLGAVKWMPDGRRLCILYGRGLYLLPVD